MFPGLMDVEKASFCETKRVLWYEDEQRPNVYHWYADMSSHSPVGRVIYHHTNHQI